MLSVCPLHSIPDHPSEAPARAPSLVLSPHENTFGIREIQKQEAEQLITKCVNIFTENLLIYFHGFVPHCTALVCWTTLHKICYVTKDF